jgi:hypothetical protein
MPIRTDWTFAARSLPLAVALLLAAAAPAAAQGEPTALQKFLGGLGLLEIPNNDRPDYRERAPLVVPPSTALIAPRSADDIAKYNPDWPVDHDNRPRAATDPEEERRADDDFYSGRALRPSEVNGRAPRLSPQEQARRNAAAGVGQATPLKQDHLSPSQLGFQGWTKKQETVVFVGEPERRSLTDPPPGLQTPSRDAPYGVVTTKVGPTKPTDLYERTQSQADPANRR